MEYLKVFIVLLHTYYTWASRCAIIAQPLNCTCDPEPYPEGRDFIAKCGTISLKYENSRNYFEVKCENALSISETLFGSFLTQDQNIEYIKFDGCTLPEKTFPKVLYDMNFKKLNIACWGRVGTKKKWSGVMVQNMNYIEELTIQGCPTDAVPDDLLQSSPSLKKLFLEEDIIQSLPEQLLYNVTKLQTLSLMNNYLQTIPDNFFQHAEALEDINIRNNQLDNISLAGLKTLKYLDLSKNLLTSIPENTFSDNTLLITLNLGLNKIVNVTTRPFQKLANLKILNMSNNKPDLILANGFLEGLEKLRNLSLSDCHMTNPPSDLLNWTRNLEYLELGNNRIVAFPDRFFQFQNKLEYLDLTFNDLMDNISENTFQGLKSLRYLSLRKNNFSTFPDNILKPMSKLGVLHFEENFLEELDMSGESVLYLSELFLGLNSISKLNQGLPFGDRTGLQVIELKGNNLSDFNVYMVPYNFVKELDLSNNHMPVVSLPVLYSQNSPNIKLINCSIQTVNCSLFAQSPSPKNALYTRYLLEANPLLCDCQQLEFQGILKTKQVNFPESNSLKCVTVSSTAYQRVIDVPSDDFICKIGPCPDSCFCFQTAKNLVVVDCQNKGLTDLSQLTNIIPSNVSVLKLQHNNLTTIRDLSQKQWTNLTEFYADYNHIKSENWALPNSLRVLSLTNNDMKWFPQCLAEFVHQPEAKLNLGQNPWNCDCSAWDFHNKVWVSLSKLDSHLITCASPDRVRGMNISSWEGKALCPDKNSPVVNIVVPILICILLACTLLSVVTFYFRNRQTIIAYLYTHWHKIFIICCAEKDLDEDRHFHAFVAYSSDDRQVVDALLTQLENKYPHYKLCIHERDWLPGNPIIWNIVNSVQNSRRTILIVSKQFLKSMWFQLEYSIAYHQMLEEKVDRLIVIVNGDIPDPSDMDEELRFLLSTKTYLIWGERWFWEKLKYALPHPNVNPCTVPRPPKERPNEGLIRKIEDKILTIASETLQGPTGENGKIGLALNGKNLETKRKKIAKIEVTNI